MNKNYKLFGIDNHNLFFLVATEVKYKRFIEEIKAQSPDNTYFASIDLSGISSLDDLYKQFIDVFRFPDYFGYNWDAFEECINDLDWLDAKSYILIVKDIEKLKLPENVIRIFLRILKDAADEWTKGRNYDDFPTPPTPFHIIFVSDKQNGLKKTFDLFKLEGIEHIGFLTI
jgi:RNAse (barnase) inhibitor barstar